jgi:hypothetical protein
MCIPQCWGIPHDVTHGLISGQHGTWQSTGRFSRLRVDLARSWLTAKNLNRLIKFQSAQYLVTAVSAQLQHHTLTG